MSLCCAASGATASSAEQITAPRATTAPSAATRGGWPPSVHHQRRWRTPPAHVADRCPTLLSRAPHHRCASSAYRSPYVDARREGHRRALDRAGCPAPDRRHRVTADHLSLARPACPP